MFWRRLLSSAALVILLLSPIAAQTPEDQSALDQQQREKKALELKKELERKTFALLDEVVGSATMLKLPENRALVQSGAADLLWTRDEKRARALFREALDNLKEIAPKATGQMSREQNRAQQLFFQQRTEILQMVARRDPDYALELLRATRPQAPPAPSNALRRLDEEDKLEQSLAIQVAANDPKRALAMAEDSLAKGLSFELLNLLNHLNEKDKDLAERLATDIIGKLSSENLATNLEAAWLAVILLRTGVPTADSDFQFVLSASGGGKKPYKLTEQQLRDLLEMVTTAALVEPSHDVILSFLQQMMPEIEKRLPERVPALRRRMTASTRRLEPQERIQVEYRELVQRGSVDSLLEAAAKAPEQAREMLYEQAAWKALYGDKDTERARRIVNDNIRDSSKRERMMQDFDRFALWNALSQEKLMEVRQMISRLKSKDERASALAQLAFLATTKKEKKLALQLLEEARPLISLKPKNDQQLYTLLQVVRVYALVEPVRAFEIIESLVDQANELLSAASVLNGFFLPSGVFRKGEMVLPPGYSDVSMRFRKFGKELAALALVSFERTKAAADKFQRNETRIMARLFIIQGVLSEQLGSGVVLYDGGMVVGY